MPEHMNNDRVGRRDLAATAHLLGIIGKDIDQLWKHYAHARTQVHGYTAGTTNPPVHTSDISDPTANYAAQLEHLRHDLEYIDASLKVIVINTNQVAKAMLRAIGTRLPIARCDGRGLEGFDQWGEACEDPPDKAGLCSRHYMRCYRWRRDNGYPPLRDSAA